ncbi:MAG TPA: hypothetical protein VFM53_13630 [Anaeromyxobacteraceae bacterium]|nr:hypothetical protein [Anaeromyxobacteraceae bacterium]
MNAPAATLALLAALAAGLAAAPAAAQERPSEEELFGKPDAPPAPPAPPPGKEPPAAYPAPPAPAAPAPPEQARMETASPQPAGFGAPPAPPDPLKIGGMLYLRLDTQWQQGQPISDWVLTSPNLIDLWVDVRPNDRVRGFVLGRAQVNPLVPETVQASALGAAVGTQVVLDQAWIRFDIERVVFVAAGKQQVTWGNARFWNPTDFLHFRKRDPLSVFDQRQGEWMLKLHAPWEKAGWNFYGFLLLSGNEVVDRIGKVGGALRAEVVLGSLELAGEVVARSGTLPRLGLEASFAVWEIDVYGNASLGRGTPNGLPQWNMTAPPDWQAVPPNPGSYESYQPGFAPQVSAGASWTWRYDDLHTLTIGAEYFYNSLGYSDPAIYPWLIVNGQYDPFYVGRNQLGLYVLIPRPWKWYDTTFILSTLANLTDRTFISRLDYSVLLLTYLRLEAYASVHYGVTGGAFRFAIDVPAFPPYLPDPVRITPPVADFGLALRLSL